MIELRVKQGLSNVDLIVASKLMEARAERTLSRIVHRVVKPIIMHRKMMVAKAKAPMLNAKDEYVSDPAQNLVSGQLRLPSQSNLCHSHPSSRRHEG